MNEFLQAVLSWPTVSIVALLVLRRPLRRLVERLIRSEVGEAKVGPIGIKFAKVAEEGRRAVGIMNRINMVMAESRRLELEMLGPFGSVFSEEQRNEMQQHRDALRQLTEEARLGLEEHRGDVPDVE